MRLLSIDPSINECGVAVIINGELIRAYTIKTQKHKSVECRLRQLNVAFTNIGHDFTHAIIEYPNTFVRKGRFGDERIGSMQVLHVAIGTIYASLCQISDIEIKFVKVSEWKGGVGKHEAQNMVRALTGKLHNTHESDAIVMGMRWQKKQLINSLHTKQNSSIIKKRIMRKIK